MAYKSKQIVKIDGRIYNVVNAQFNTLVINCDTKDDMLHIAKWSKEFSKYNTKEEKNLLKKDIEFETDTHIGTYEKVYPHHQLYDLEVVILYYEKINDYWKEEI